MSRLNVLLSVCTSFNKRNDVIKMQVSRISRGYISRYLLTANMANIAIALENTLVANSANRCLHFKSITTPRRLEEFKRIVFSVLPIISVHFLEMFGSILAALLAVFRYRLRAIGSALTSILALVWFAYSIVLFMVVRMCKVELVATLSSDLNIARLAMGFMSKMSHRISREIFKRFLEAAGFADFGSGEKCKLSDVVKCSHSNVSPYQMRCLEAIGASNACGLVSYGSYYTTSSSGKIGA